MKGLYKTFSVYILIVATRVKIFCFFLLLRNQCKYLSSRFILVFFFQVSFSASRYVIVNCLVRNFIRPILFVSN